MGVVWLVKFQTWLGLKCVSFVVLLNDFVTECERDR